MGTLVLEKENSHNFIKNYVDAFLNQDRHCLILKLTLMFAFTLTRSEYYLHIPLQAFTLYMVLSDVLAKNKTAWIVNTAVHFLIIFSQWDYIDNHKWLSCYWMLACNLSLYVSNPLKMLRESARMLIGWLFFIATFHKFDWLQFHDGSFMHFTFLTDGRFEWTMGLTTGMTMDKLPANYRAEDFFSRLPLAFDYFNLNTNLGIRIWAFFSSWWVIFIEGIVGISFLFAKKSRFFNQIKDGSLIVFMITTYSIVMVSGFNFMLLLLGFANTRVNQKKICYWYMFCFCLFEFRKLPLLRWSNILFGTISSYFVS